MAQAAPALISAIPSIVGGIGSLFDQGKQTITPMGSPEAVTNVNPYTSNYFNQLMGLQGDYTAGRGQFSPTMNIQSLAGATPLLNQISSSLISPYGTSLNNTANMMANEARRKVANDFSNLNAVNSGAALSAMARGTAQPISEAVTNIAGMQSQLGGGLGNALLSQMGGMGNSILGSSMGALGQYAAPEWWQPTYAQGYQPGFFEKLSGFGGQLGTMIPGIMSMFPKSTVPTT